MSLRGYAMLAAIGYHNHRSSSGDNNNHNDSTSTTRNTGSTGSTTEKIGTAALSPTSPTSPTSLRSLVSPTTTTTKTITNSNKSTLKQLRQQQSDSLMTTTSTSIVTTITSPPPPSTTATRSKLTTAPATRPSATFRPLHNNQEPATPLNPYSSRPGDHFQTKDDDHHRHHPHHRHQHHHHSSSSSTSNSSGNIYADSDEDPDEEELDEGEEEEEDRNANAAAEGSNEMTGRQRPANTFYGSGFGIFHQQRSNMGGAGGGGGIALITGSSGSGLGSSSYSNGINNNVNLLLGGAMLTLITTILCVVCYCCHRNIKKRTEAAYRQQRQWLENDPNMEIYSVEQCYETSGLFVGDSMDGLATIPALHHEPPPSYDAVVAMQEQQQILLQQQQQQLLMQQLQNNSPPPGYRSSVDVSCLLAARAAALSPAVLGMGSNDTNSLTASSVNVRTATSRTPPDGNDSNGNRDMGSVVATTSNGGYLQQPSFLRTAKQQRQRQLPTANLTNFNMKKVLQAQSCCSLQRAEVENMWNAAAAALAARTNHISNDPRGTASTSSPTLVMNNRKLSNAQAASATVTSSKANTPETFGSRYLKQQNYYRRGCPLCGKFRYDNESMLSISMESDLDNMTTDGGSSTAAVDGTHIDDSSSSRDTNLNSGLAIGAAASECEEVEDDECSCVNSHRRPLRQQTAARNAETIAVAVVNPYHSENNNNHLENPPNAANNAQEAIELMSAPDLNANHSMAMEVPTTTLSLLSSSSNNNNNNIEEPSCSSSSTRPTLLTAAVTVATASASSSPAASASASASASTPHSLTIDLDCINENGIISLDMSKIIDKTGLPTYDAALKLESSGYV